jgi:hypothetical protein
MAVTTDDLLRLDGFQAWIKDAERDELRPARTARFAINGPIMQC